VINGDSYKKWMKKLSAEKAKLEDQMSYLEPDPGGFYQSRIACFAYTLNIPKVFEDSSLNQQHAIINAVFKEGLTFRDGMFRTPCINPAFAHNVLSLKQKGLLVVEQPSKDFYSISSCGEGGIRTLGTVSRTSV
jgi:site-specific DNA recombinase